MISKLTALGDRLLDLFLPSVTASAAVCPGRFDGCAGSCCYYCRMWNPNRCTKIKYCDYDPGCKNVCHDCCC